MKAVRQSPIRPIATRANRASVSQDLAYHPVARDSISPADMASSTKRGRWSLPPGLRPWS